MPSTTEQVGDAIAALTAAARGTRTIGAGTPYEHTEPVDFAEIACHVLTAVAANVGGVEELLAGRPGAWEADYVCQIVHSTAGDRPDDLALWRTEPDHLGPDPARGSHRTKDYPSPGAPALGSSPPAW